MGSYEALYGPEDNMIRRQFQHKANQKVLTCQKRIKMRHSATDRPTNRKTKENTMNVPRMRLVQRKVFCRTLRWKTAEFI